MGTDASICLLERTGDFKSVLELLLKDYEEALGQLQESFVERGKGDRAALSRVLKQLTAPAKEQDPLCADETKSESPWWEGFQDAQRCIHLLEHAEKLSSKTSTMTEAELERMWFGLLELTVRKQEGVSVD